MSEQSVKKLSAQKYSKSKSFHKTYKQNAAQKHDQSKPKAVVKPASSFLPSNWTRYDEPVEDIIDSSSGLDFNTLTLLPESYNTFQLKQDKAFLAANNTDLQLGDFFQLDLKFIELSLSTIPFYQRIGIDKDCLNENELKFMDQKALEATKDLQQYTSIAALPSIQECTITSNELVPTHSMENSLEILPCNFRIKEHGDTNSETQELEDWLDKMI